MRGSRICTSACIAVSRTSLSVSLSASISAATVRGSFACDSRASCFALSRATASASMAGHAPTMPPTHAVAMPVPTPSRDALRARPARRPVRFDARIPLGLRVVASPGRPCATRLPGRLALVGSAAGAGAGAGGSADGATACTAAASAPSRTERRPGFHGRALLGPRLHRRDRHEHDSEHAAATPARRRVTPRARHGRIENRHQPALELRAMRHRQAGAGEDGGEAPGVHHARDVEQLIGVVGAARAGGEHQVVARALALGAEAARRHPRQRVEPVGARTRAARRGASGSRGASRARARAAARCAAARRARCRRRPASAPTARRMPHAIGIDAAPAAEEANAARGRDRAASSRACGSHGRVGHERACGATSTARRRVPAACGRRSGAPRSTRSAAASVDQLGSATRRLRRRRRDPVLAVAIGGRRAASGDAQIAGGAGAAESPRARGASRSRVLSRDDRQLPSAAAPARAPATSSALISPSVQTGGARPPTRGGAPRRPAPWPPGSTEALAIGVHDDVGSNACVMAYTPLFRAVSIRRARRSSSASESLRGRARRAAPRSPARPSRRKRSAGCGAAPSAWRCRAPTVGR